jgi:hypothetical protein
MSMQVRAGPPVGLKVAREIRVIPDGAARTTEPAIWISEI